jgi:biopolymer transport protein ExbB
MLVVMRRALMAILGLTTACGFSASPAPGGPGDDGAAGSDAAIADAPIDPPIATPDAHRRKLITIDHTKVTGGTLQDFPVWIDLDDTAIATRAQANGSDLYFTAADGTALDHEIQIADRANHHFAAWVRIPALSNTTDTTLYVNYGDPAAAPTANSKGVFKASFAAVWHLDDADLTQPIADATRSHAGTPHVTAATKSAPGKLGNGLAFDGTANERIEFSNPLTGNNPHTISVWVAQAANLDHTAAIVNMGNTSIGNARWLHGHYSPGAGPASLAAGFYSLDFNPTPVENLDGAGLTYVVWVFEGPNKKNRLYRNGARITAGEFMAGNGINTTGTAGFIGYAPLAYGVNNQYSGTIDELRIATAVRSDGWIATEYANQRSPTTFFTIGPELTP